jgi:hypothetical protein
VIHFLFLAAAVAYLARGTQATYWRALAAFVAGDSIETRKDDPVWTRIA